MCSEDSPLFVADWEGKNIGWRVWDGTQELHVSRDDMLNGILWASGPVRLVIEHAHMHERGPLSVAQVYNHNELTQFFAASQNAGSLIQAFPQRLTERARTEGIHPDEGVRYAELDNPKQYDPRAIYDFVLNRPEVSLKNWRPRTPDDTAFYEIVNEIRQDMTIRLNDMRPDYDPENSDVQHAVELLEIFASGIPEITQQQFGLEFYRTNRIGHWQQGDLKSPLKASGGARTGFNVIMAVYVAVYDSEQNLRVNEEGNFIGMKFIWNYLFLMSPFSGKSGTARSNLMFRGLSSYDKRHMNNIRYQYRDTPEIHTRRREVWAQWRRGIKLLMRHFRDAATD